MHLRCFFAAANKRPKQTKPRTELYLGSDKEVFNHLTTIDTDDTADQQPHYFECGCNYFN